MTNNKVFEDGPSWRLLVLAGFRRGYRIWILASGSSEGRPCTFRVLDACIVTAEAGAHAAMQREFERKQCSSPNMH